MFAYCRGSIINFSYELHGLCSCRLMCEFFSMVPFYIETISFLQFGELSKHSKEHNLFFSMHNPRLQITWLRPNHIMCTSATSWNQFGPVLLTTRTKGTSKSTPKATSASATFNLAFSVGLSVFFACSRP